MYTAFYNLNKKPFQISSDPSFMWFGEKHKEALATLKYGILDNKGFLLLTGDVGTGKTTLINALTQSLTDDVICTSVPDPGLEKMDFFNYIASAFGIEKEFSSKGAFLANFRQFLLGANTQNKKVLLIIDEAQLLTQEMLEEIRLLSNIEKMDTKLINIFFVGQNEFNEILNREQNRAVRQRLTLNYNIDPLTPDETAEYITHRLKVAGAGHQIFDASAAQEVFLYSGGFPRRINVICDHSLLSGYVNEQKTITADIVKECARELKIPSHIPHRNINGFYSDSEKEISPKSNTPKGPQTYPEVRPIMREEKKSRLPAIAAILLFLLTAVFAWYVLFPQDFKSVSSSIGRYFPSVSPKNQTAGTGFFAPQNKISDTGSNPLITHPQPDKKKEVQHNDPADLKVVKKKITADVPDKNQPETQGDFIKPENLLEHHLDTAAPDPVVEIKKGLKTDDPILEKQDSINDGVDTAILPLPKEKVIVRFKYNTNDFTGEGYQKLEEFSRALAGHPDTKILISGYTDSEGYKKYNIKLSEFRANIVRSFLLGRGISPDQIRVRGLGSKNPIENNETGWGRMMNRRVEIEIVR